MSLDHSKSFIISAALVAVGIVAASFVAGGALVNMRMMERSVSVKGVAEREVVADMALWSLKTKVAGDDLVQVQTSLEANLGKIKSFLVERGLNANEMTVSPLRVVDRSAQEYGNATANQMRYLIEASVAVRTDNIARMQEISQMTSELVRMGVTLSDENSCNYGPQYLFTKLNQVKPEMLAEATKSARESAQQFATDSGSKVGKIRQASQGYFSISSRDYVEAGEGGGGCGIPSDPNKKVRVVTSIDYYLAE